MKIYDLLTKCFIILGVFIFGLITFSNKAYALIVIPPGGSTSSVNLDASFAKNYLLPSPGDTITASLIITNNTSDTVTFSGEIGLDFYTIDTSNPSNPANGSQAYFTNPSPRRTGTWTIAPGGSKTESFDTGITSGGCTSGNVNLLAVPYFIATVSHSEPGTASTTGGVGASMYGNVFKSDGSWAAVATVNISSGGFDANQSTTTSSTGFYAFKNLNCAYTHTVSVSSFQGESGSSTIPSSSSTASLKLCNGEDHGPFPINLVAPTPTPTPTVTVRL